MYHRWTAATSLILTLLVLTPGAKAVDIHRQYEEDLIRWALSRTGLQLEPDPHGKIIERIEIVRENIIAQSDPWPNFINWFHITTKAHVVRQEMLISPGQVWDQALVEESTRNLRKLPILAVVRAVPCRSRLPGQVVLLVVTKDLWSIRLNTVLDVVGSVVHSLDFNPTEMNFLGRNKQLALHVGLRELDLGPFAVRDRIVVGQRYVDNRVLGSRLQLYEYFDASIAGRVPSGGLNPDGERWVPSSNPGDLQGIYALLELERPLYSLATKWGFNVYAIADVSQVRNYVVNGSSPPVGEDQGLSIDTVTIDNSYVPRVYDAHRFYGAASVARSFGSAIKHDLIPTVGVYSHRYAPPDNFPFSEAVVQTYKHVLLPHSEDVAYLEFLYHTYQAQYLQLRNVKTFALTEDFMLGHDISFSVRAAANLPDTDLGRGFLEVTLKAGYLWHLRGDLLQVWLNAGTRWQPALQAEGYPAPWAKNSVEVGVYNITPKLGLGRLHTRVRGILRDNNIDNVWNGLGGNAGLRGYTSNSFLSENLLQANLEYRSLPINLYTLHVGFVLFYDAGSVWGRDARAAYRTLPFQYHHSLGLGVRGHFPQFDKSSLRIDFGGPLSGSVGGAGNWISIAFGQVF